MEQILSKSQRKFRSVAEVRDESIRSDSFRCIREVRREVCSRITEMTLRFLTEEVNPLWSVLWRTLQREGGCCGSSGGTTQTASFKHHAEDPIEGWVQLQDVEGCYAKDTERFELGYQSISEAPIWRIQNMKRDIRNGKRQKVFDPFHYKIGDTSQLSKYQRGGILKQVRVPA